MKHPIHFVGAGPGDPELITVKGRRLLEEADCVVYAGSLVPDDLLMCCKAGADKVSSASLTLEETHALLLGGYHRGLRVVRLHTGDPALYGAIHEQMVLLDRDDIPYEVVPGISAVFAAAAALKQELTLPEVSQTLILTRLGGRTPVPEKEQLRLLAEHQATLAIYLSVQNLTGVVQELLAAYPPQTPVVVAYRVGWPDQQLVHGSLQDIVERVQAAGIRRQALILVGAVFAARTTGTAKRSQLYHESFHHGYRGSQTAPSDE
jgi:precorrin-4/cobalt-precorrin-4 C11-methyltransferase